VTHERARSERRQVARAITCAHVEWVEMKKRDSSEKKSRTDLAQRNRITKDASRGRGRSRYPFERRYDLMRADGEENPIDALIEQIPEIVAVRKKVRTLALRVRDRVADVPMFIDLQDLRVLQGAVREEAYFDAGFAEGQIVGRAESLDRSAANNSRASRSLVRKIRRAVLESRLTGTHAAAVLIEVSRAIVLGLEASVSSQVPTPEQGNG
jgi:hypothetical protein